MRLELWIALVLFIMALRAFLIVLGVYKTPILRRFENYGSEIYYSPMLGLITWGTGFMMFMLGLFVNPSAVILAGGFMSMPILVLLYYKADDLIRDFPEFFLKSPAWYHDVSRNCTREDRRRLAYMWLRLPLRTRLLYSTNDYHFMQWVDLVVVSIA